MIDADGDGDEIKAKLAAGLHFLHAYIRSIDPSQSRKFYALVVVVGTSSSGVEGGGDGKWGIVLGEESVGGNEGNAGVTEADDEGDGHRRRGLAAKPAERAATFTPRGGAVPLVG